MESGRQDVSSSQRDRERSDEVRVWQIGKPIEKALERSWPYSDGAPYFTGNGGFGLIPQFAARYFVEGVLQGVAPAAIVSKLERIFQITGGERF